MKTIPVNKQRILSLAFCSVLLFSLAPVGFAQPGGNYPIPVSENIEETGPGSMTFLSYPKYYRNEENALTLVDTTLRASKQPDWDYEVTAGIWTFRARLDGTFQAEHAGDVFTYRFSRLGVGRGEAFRAFDWGEPRWSEYQVMGDTIRWTNVYPDVDLVVRYIHDILKVDVIVKEALLERIRSDVKAGRLNGEDYLTARFEIPNVLIQSEARQDGKPCDLFADAVDMNQPIEFVKDDRVIHRLRPVETYVRDKEGNPLEPEPDAIVNRNGNIRIHSAQIWRLRPDAPGLAEMSANLGDLAAAPKGDVVIDPSLIFGSGQDDQGTPYPGEIYDSYLAEGSPSTNYGSFSTVQIENYSGSSFRTILSVTTASQLAGRIIKSASIRLYNDYVWGATTAETAKAYKVTTDWVEASVTWNNSGAGSAWSGGDYASGYQSPPVTLPSSAANDWIEFDVSYAFKSHFATDENDLKDKGFLIKVEDSQNAYWQFRSSEHMTVGDRPQLRVTFEATDFGAHVPPVHDNPVVTGWLNRMRNDEFELARYLDDPSVPTGWLPNFCSQAQSEGLKVFIHTPVAHNIYARMDEPIETVSDYAYHIIQLLHDGATYIENGTIIAIEIGGEESDWLQGSKTFTDVWFEDGFTPNWGSYFGNEDAGSNFAEYYLAALNVIKDCTITNSSKLQIWSGGSPEKHESITYIGDTYSGYGSAADFISGFLDEVILEGREYLPDAISLHGYSGKLPPEYYVNTSAGVTEWFTRLEELYNVCINKSYIPNFVVTEYGFSPSNDNWGPTNASETTQAVYYLRSCLINATVQPHDGIGWGISSYFSHNKGAVGDNHGFSNNDPYDMITYGNNVDHYFGSWRKIKRVSRALLASATTIDLKLNDPETKIWLPLKSVWTSDLIGGYAWCGWETSDGTKWGAIWRYKRGTAYSTFTPDAKSFTFPSSFGTMTVTNRYQFDFSLNPTFLDNISESDLSGSTSISIPGVSENPIILEFQ